MVKNMGLRISTRYGAYPEAAICQLCSPVISLSKTSKTKYPLLKVKVKLCGISFNDKLGVD